MISILLRGNAKDKTRPVVLRYTYDKNRTEFPVKPEGSKLTVKVLPQKWNDHAKRVTRSHPNAEAINSYIDDFYAKVDKAYHNLVIKGETPTPAKIRKELLVEPGDGGFWSFIEEDFMPSVAVRLSGGTVENYEALLKLLGKYEALAGTPIRTKDIGMGFFSGFSTYLFETGLRNSTVKKHITNLKVVLKAAAAAGHPFDPACLRFQVPVGQINYVTLTREEIRKLECTPFVGDHKTAVDIFLFMLYGCLRLSEVREARKENLEGDILTYYMRKIRKWHTSLLPAKAITIWEKYNYEFPEEIFRLERHRNLLNVSLREACQQAGISDNFTEIRLHRGRMMKTTLPRYAFITTHTARRTSINIANKEGLPVPFIQGAAGHASQSTTLKYIQQLSREGEFEAYRNLWNN